MHRPLFLTFIGIVVLLVGTSVLLVSTKTNSRVAAEETLSPTELALQTAVIDVPQTQETVTLAGGKSDMKQGGYTQMGNVTAEKGKDVFADFSVNYGGSGVFAYIGMFRELDGQMTLISSLPLADRIIVTSIVPGKTNKDKSYDVTINYLDRTIEQAMSEAPTIKVQRTLTISGNAMTDRE